LRGPRVLLRPAVANKSCVSSSSTRSPECAGYAVDRPLRLGSGCPVVAAQEPAFGPFPDMGTVECRESLRHVVAMGIGVTSTCTRWLREGRPAKTTDASVTQRWASR
jgi:hypothetical protein